MIWGIRQLRCLAENEGANLEEVLVRFRKLSNVIEVPQPSDLV